MTNPTPTPTLEELAARVTTLEQGAQKARRRIERLEEEVARLSQEVGQRRPPVRRKMRELEDRLEALEPTQPTQPPPVEGARR